MLISIQTHLHNIFIYYENIDQINKYKSINSIKIWDNHLTEKYEANLIDSIESSYSPTEINEQMKNDKNYYIYSLIKHCKNNKIKVQYYRSTIIKKNEDISIYENSSQIYPNIKRIYKDTVKLHLFPNVEYITQSWSEYYSPDISDKHQIKGIDARKIIFLSFIPKLIQVKIKHLKLQYFSWDQMRITNFISLHSLEISDLDCVLPCIITKLILLGKDYGFEDINKLGRTVELIENSNVKHLILHQSTLIYILSRVIWKKLEVVEVFDLNIKSEESVRSYFRYFDEFVNIRYLSVITKCSSKNLNECRKDMVLTPYIDSDGNCLNRFTISRIRNKEIISWFICCLFL